MFGLSPFEIILSLAWLGAIAVRIAEWVFKQTHGADECVKKSEWSAARQTDSEEARHFTRNELTFYVPQRLYDRDWKEVNRRLEQVEGMVRGMGT